MKPILYSPKDTNFENNGIGVLVDAISCEVTEERNGSFELVMRYPVTGQWYSEIKTDCKIKAKPNNKAEPQLFVVYAISKPLNGIVTINAEHISYQLSSVIVLPFTASSSMAALDGIKYHSANENPFVFEDHWKGNGDFAVKTPSSARSLLGGVEGSIIDTYGGEYEFDNYAVRLWANRGRDNGVVIAYAKNLTGVKCDERIDGIATGCLGYYKKEEEGGVEVSVYGDLQTVENDMSYSRDVIVDFSSDFEATPTKEQLNEKSKQYLKQAKNGAYFSVSVEFVNLGDTEEYKQYKELEEVNLCDIVAISHPYYGISVKSKVVRTVYDCLKERYIKIDVGEVRGSLAKTIAVQSKEIKEKPSIKEMNAAYENANWWITNGQIGEIVMIRDKEGKLVEIASLDTGDKTTAKNVWRWNNGGFAHSSMGYNLPDNQWDVALLSDGSINGDLIRTGKIMSLNGLSYIDLNTGDMQLGVGSVVARVGNSRDGYTAFLVKDGDRSIIDAYNAGFINNGIEVNGVVWTASSYTNDLGTNRKGVSIFENNISLFGDFNGQFRGVTINTDTGRIDIIGEDVYINNVSVSEMNKKIANIENKLSTLE